MVQYALENGRERQPARRHDRSQKRSSQKCVVIDSVDSRQGRRWNDWFLKDALERDRRSETNVRGARYVKGIPDRAAPFSNMCAAMSAGTYMGRSYQIADPAIRRWPEIIDNLAGRAGGRGRLWWTCQTPLGCRTIKLILRLIFSDTALSAKNRGLLFLGSSSWFLFPSATS